MWHRDHKVSKWCWKSGTNRFARYKLPQTFNFWKKQQTKGNNVTLGTPIKCSAGKESTVDTGDPGSTPGSERSAGEGIGYPLQYSRASLVARMVKNPPAMRETWVGSLGWEDPLEKRKATHSSILAWRVLWTVYSPCGRKELDTTNRLSLQCLPVISWSLALKLENSSGIL